MRFHSPITQAIILGILSAAAVCGQITFVNGASFNASQPLAPDSFASAFGQNLCSHTGTAQWTGDGRLPTDLGGCSVVVNGTPAMMYYVSPGQMNFVIPPGLIQGQAPILIHNGADVQTGSMTIGAAGPGVFALNGMGTGEGAMLNAAMWRQSPFSTTTGGHPTSVAIYATGLDLSAMPVVTIGGLPAEVTWFGEAPGYAGLHQINVALPAGTAGAGRVPVTVTSNGQTSNVTFMHVLPTTAMMQGAPGWAQGRMVDENTPRPREVSYVAVNPANNTAVVTDENDDAVRVISLSSQSTVATITLPEGSAAHGVAVNAASTLAAVALSAKSSVALIDLAQNTVAAVIGTGYYPSRMAFSGTNLLVTNQASGTLSVIDTESHTIIRTVTVGFGPSGLAATGATAIVANMQAGSLSLVDLANFTVRTVALPDGSRPRGVAVSATADKAIVTMPLENAVYLLDLGTSELTRVDTAAFSGVGPAGVAASGNLAYIANQLMSSVSVVDLGTGQVVKVIPVDYGPCALAVNPATNQLVVLAGGTGTLDVIDLDSGQVVARLNGADTERQGRWTLPWITAVTPNTAAAGTTFTLTINGTGFQSVHDIEFALVGGHGGGPAGMGPGMGGGPHGSDDAADPNIEVSNIQVSTDGTTITASVHILPAATPGFRQIHLETDWGEVMGMPMSVFTITP